MGKEVIPSHCIGSGLDPPKKEIDHMNQSKYVLVMEVSDGIFHFMRDLNGDNCFTDDIGCAEVFDERAAIRERIDEEFIAVLKYDQDGGIQGFERVVE